MTQHLPQFDRLEEAGWEIRHQVTYIVPARTSASIAGYEARPAPRTNVVISQVPASPTAGTPREAAQEFLVQTTSLVPGMQRVEEGMCHFEQGRVEGYRVVIQFLAPQDVWLEQHHFFRVDGPLLTQAVVTRDREVEDDDFELALEAVTHMVVPAPVA